MDTQIPVARSGPPPRRAVSWGSGDIFMAVGIILAALPLLITVGRMLIALTPISPSGATIAISVALQGLLLASVWLFAVRRYRLPWTELGFVGLGDRRGLRYTLAAVLGSLAVVSMYGAVIRALGLEHHVPQPPIFREPNPMLLAVGIAAATLIAPFVEEVFFRGFVFAGLLKSMGPWAAALISSGLFALAHMSPFLYPPVFLIGLLLAWVYYRTGSLWYSVLAHLGYNSLVAWIALSSR